MTGKALQYLKSCLYINSIIPFAIIEDLFNHLKDIFGNLYWKKHAMEIFWELKMGINLFKDFYLEFICLVLDLEYTFEILIWKFKHKLTPCFQYWLNSGIELPTSILALVKRCLSIYKQMQAKNRIRDRTKSLWSTSTPVPIYSNTRTA